MISRLTGMSGSPRSVTLMISVWNLRCRLSCSLTCALMNEIPTTRTDWRCATTAASLSQFGHQRIAVSTGSMELTRFCGHPETVVRRCPDDDEALRAGVPAADGEVGTYGSDGGRAVAGVRVLGAGGPQLCTAGGP